MAINFPDPDVTTEYSHITSAGATVSYIWDGEKWNTEAISGAGASDTSELLLVKAIGNPFADLPDLNTLTTQEDYNEFVYTAVGDIYSGDADILINGEEY